MVTADVVRPVISSEGDFAKYRGTLRGKIVLTQPARAVRMLDGRIVLRYGPEEIREAMTLPPPRPPRARSAENAARDSARTRLTRAIEAFYKAEGVVALLDRGSDADSSAGGSDLSWYTQRTDGGTVFVGGTTRDSTAPGAIPTVTLAVEHYNRMVRILDKGVPVRMELEVRTQFHDETTTPRGFNIIAEIPGTDPALRDEVVLIGAHFDSWHGGTGATDNATGSTAMMEAMRILKAVGARPRRTIRIALWGAEEQGLLGSRAYARAHYGVKDSTGTRLTPAQARVSAYYNIDNGTGKIRGIWMQENPGVAPVFAEFAAPLKDLGVDILSPRSVSATDHSSFDALGIPAFQFVQERYEYNSRTHHSTMDVVDRVQADDLKQIATVVAAFAYLTAQRDALLPRK
jgi:carboxypeptidase Q